MTKSEQILDLYNKIYALIKQQRPILIEIFKWRQLGGNHVNFELMAEELQKQIEVLLDEYILISA